MEAQFKYSRKEVEKGIPNTKKYLGVKRFGDEYFKTVDFKKHKIIFREDLKDFVLDYYADTKNPAALRGRDALFNAIRAEHVGISRRDIASILKNHETQQVFTVGPVVTISRPIVATKPLAQWAADLTYITRNNIRDWNFPGSENEDEKLFTLLVVVDMFSKHAWAEIIHSGKQKFTAESVAAAMSKILAKESPNTPAVLRSDNGVEFTSNAWKELMGEYKIKQVFSETYNPRQNSHVERLNRTLKTLIGKYLNSVNGIALPNEKLQEIVASYNATQHSSTKQRPIDIHPGKVKKPAQITEEMQDGAYYEMKNRANKLVAEARLEYPKLRVGDVVRVHRRTEGTWRRATKLKAKIYQPQYSYELYRVAEISRPKPGLAAHYQLRDMENKLVNRKFLRQDLLGPIDVQNLVRELMPGHFQVEAIRDKKIVDGEVRYLVKWSGWPESSNSWERPQKGYQRLIDLYEKN